MVVGLLCPVLVVAERSGAWRAPVSWRIIVYGASAGGQNKILMGNKEISMDFAQSIAEAPSIPGNDDVRRRTMCRQSPECRAASDRI
jgi:hypothetical protein